MSSELEELKASVISEVRARGAESEPDRVNSELAPAECEVANARCTTCSDEGVAMRVLELRDGCAICTDERRDTHEVAVDLVLPVAVADEILVHAGVAIRHLGSQR